MWTHIDWRAGKVRIPGTKTEESDAWLPVAPAVLRTLRELYESENRNPASPYVFPSRSAQTRGKKIYSRRRIFERIQRETAIKKHLRHHPEASREQAFEVCRKENFKGGIHLTPKDLRDYFCTEIAAGSNDANVAMRLMRHTSLTTTTKYMRAVKNRMREAVNSLGAVSRGDLNSPQGHKSVQNDIQEKMAELARMLSTHGNFGGLFGGGGQIRTVDAADMSRVL